MALDCAFDAAPRMNWKWISRSNRRVFDQLAVAIIGAGWRKSNGPGAAGGGSHCHDSCPLACCRHCYSLADCDRGISDDPDSWRQVPHGSMRHLIQHAEDHADGDSRNVQTFLQFY